MHGPRIALTVRSTRSRPRWPWAAAWQESRNHDLSTISAWRYARETIEHGGVRGLAVPVAAAVVFTVLVVAVSFSAAVLANESQSSAAHGTILILVSVIVSQLLAAAQVGRKARRVLITAQIRVVDLPPGWGVARLRVTPPAEANAIRTRLESAAFKHVEISYLADRGYAEMDAFFPLDSTTPDGEELVAAALPGVTSHLVTGITLSPPRAPYES